MCGIATIFSYRDGPQVDESELLKIREQMVSRGPDGAGIWVSPDRRIGLAHRRLAIVDLSPVGAQPMFDDTGMFGITFNGEIYNYRDLRAQLETKGFRFKSTSDTEVLLHLYADRGVAMLDCLRGMYAFALWDNRKKALFLARDPYGIKPLYFADDGHTFRAASQVKALLAGGMVDTGPNPAGHVGFFLWGHVPDPHTLYRGIHAVPAGSSVWLKQGSSRREATFCSVPEIFAGSARNQAESRSCTETVREALRDTVRHHRIADVPVGVFLSSGVDSTTLAALAAEQGGSLRTVTLGFEEYKGTPNDETPSAEEVARLYGAQHQTIWISRHDFEDRREHLFASMDQPTIDGANTYFVSLAARESGLKVALSGLGGDELFGGYPSFRQIPRLVKSLRPFRSLTTLGRGFRMVSVPWLKRLTSPKYAGLLEYGGSYAGAYLLRRGLFMPWELPEVLDADMVRAGWQALQTLNTIERDTTDIHSPRSTVSCLESCWYMRNQLLRDADWAGMAHSLEIRVPLVDIELLRSTAEWIANGAPPGKQTLFSAPLRPLPESVMTRPKTGFGIPVREWLSAHGEKSGPNAPPNRDRGVRAWAKVAYSQFSTGFPPATARRHQAPIRDKKVLVLVTDAFGGRGGISQFNRDLLRAISSHRDVAQVTVLPRVIVEDPGPLPDRLFYETGAAGGKAAFGYHLARLLAQRTRFSSVVCGHLHLLPLAAIAARRYGVPLILIIHGIEAWQPPRIRGLKRCLHSVDAFVSVSNLTKQRFLEWAPLRQEQGHVIPNCVDFSKFGPGPRPPHLLQRYGLSGHQVIMTLARLTSGERYKGIDEVLDVMPSLIQEIPSLAYLIVGDGSDRSRLESKVAALRLERQVVFAGYVPEKEKADHYRLADAFVMPGCGEGFGIVYLEAMACGIPIVASKADASREAVLEGQLGQIVDPESPEEIRVAIRKALSEPRAVPPGLQYFSFERFVERWHGALTHPLFASSAA